MGNRECSRLKGNPCGPLRLNTINVTMPALRSAPGPHHFIHINGREYALQRIRIGVREGRLRLEGVVLVRTGFLPNDSAQMDRASTRLGPEPRRPCG